MTFSSFDMLALRDLFHRSYNAVGQGEEEIYRKALLTTVQFDVLFALSDMESPVTVNLLSARLNKSSNSVTMLLDRMEKEGLVKRARNLKDRRATRVIMTVAGKERLAGIRPALAAFMDQLTEGLSARDISAFRMSLEKIHAAGEKLQETK
jgi:DNA-binding MarR family transcriptional regulator